jgi:hypothetical protein
VPHSFASVTWETTDISALSESQENFAPCYTHLHHDADGRVIGLAISHPGRFQQTQIGDLLDAIAEGINEGIAAVAEAAT